MVRLLKSDDVVAKTATLLKHDPQAYESAEGTSGSINWRTTLIFSFRTFPNPNLSNLISFLKEPQYFSCFQ